VPRCQTPPPAAPPGRLKVLHVVTLCSPDMKYGGPLRVALNLSAQLRDRGHMVVLAGGADGYQGRPPRSVEGTPASLTRLRRLLPGAGFSGLGSTRLLARLARLMVGADVVHVHLSRDLVAMPAAVLALILGRPLVVQCHGMVDRSERRSARPFDLLLTRRVLRRAIRILVLTETERHQVEAVARTELPQARELPNGVPAVTVEPLIRSRRMVVFAARLAERKRPTVFVEMAGRVLATVPDAAFLMIGPDEGQAAAVQDLIRARRLDGLVSYAGPLSHPEVLRQIARAAVYVLPAVDEPFGMTVVEAMSVGTPVVVTDTCGVAEQVRLAGAGKVTGPAAAALAEAVAGLLADNDTRAVCGANAARAARTMFDLDAVADRLEAVYAEAVGDVAARQPAAGRPE
jgi:glycosyltransferase involved in cell wall biosynthesis